MRQHKMVAASMQILCSTSFFFILVTFLSTLQVSISIVVHTLNMSQPLKDGDTLLSAGGRFHLGFFTPNENTKDRYLGIWYCNIQPATYVWVANRENPIRDSLGLLMIGDQGNLVLVDKKETVIWSSGKHNISYQNIVAELWNSGNLVLRDGHDRGSEDYIWQSFDHPSDTLLPGMKLGWVSSLDYNLTSWKGAQDPSPGNFSYITEPLGLPQMVLRKGSAKLFQTGPWDGVQFSGVRLTPSLMFMMARFVYTSQEVYFTYDAYNETTISRLVMNYSGSLQLYLWDEKTLEWNLLHTTPRDPCDEYGKCGQNALCTINNPRICSCLSGYTPKSQQDWDMLIWSNGCVRKTQLNCPKGEGFNRLKGVKMPDFLQFWINTNMTLRECKEECTKNCSCTAYANANATGDGSGCILWLGDLLDIRQLIEYGNQHLYLRVAAEDLVPDAHTKWMMFVVAAIFALFTTLAATFYFFWKRRTARAKRLAPEEDESSLDLPILDTATISLATDNFSLSNKIGEGGFGPVYKGRLQSGQEIAVKRMSESSRQGLNEFKNEIMSIAKLQHRNLVKLLGCCIEGEERMLIYEYMSNGSLDSYITGKTKGNILTWERRFDIIVGIARGLLYLHRDSRLRIIHRDLKVSNVLLDGEMNPKISDFGTARAFGGDSSLAKTKRIVGTYGYMAPEYAIDGLFSMKSDVFSFGVLVLEIVSGKRNREYLHPDHSFNLLGHAWKLWIEGKPCELIDEQMEGSFIASQVVNCIHIGLLCVQKNPQDRPTISSVLLMLDTDAVILPQPKEPGFFTERNLDETDTEMNGHVYGTNEISLTLYEGR